MTTKIKKTSVSGRVPNTFILSADGDIGINTHDGKLWVSNGSVVFEIGAGSGSGVPGGLDTQIQFNDSNQFAGDAGLTYNKTTDALTLAGLLYVGANVIANTSALFVGNSSVNSIITANSASLGNTTITGFANISSTLDAGNTTITGFANISSTLDAGNTTITGFANISSTLDAGNTTITGFANVSSTLAAGNTTITGFANVSSTLAAGNTTITGFANVSSTLDAGNTTITGFANVSSTLAAGNTTITGFANVSSTLQVSANIIFGTTTISANGSVGAAGYTLTSGASGNVYWSAQGSELTTVDSTTSRTLTATDAGTVIEFTNGSAVTVTVANNATQNIPVNSTIYLIQGNTGQVTVSLGAGVTIDYSDSLKTRTQESMIGLKQIQINKWQIFGDTEPSAPARSALIRSAATNGVPEFVAATSDGQVLKRTSGTVGFTAVTAAEVTNTPSGTIAATTVQAAIDELNSEKHPLLTSGTATLVAGTVTVSTSAVTTTTRIFLTTQSLGTVTTPKSIAVTSRVNGTSFTITSEDNTDTSVIAWMFIQP